MELRGQGLVGKELKDAGDRTSHEFLMHALARHRPGDVVLSEEGADDRARLVAERVWIVDPVDGTREYSEPGRTDWAVHVALWEKGDLVAGAVSRPAAGVVHSTDNPLAGDSVDAGRIRLAVSRSRPPEFVSRLAEILHAELVPMGSAGVKAMSVVTGESDAYVHAGGQYEWDSAAPVAVARAAGLHTSRLDGSPLVYNQPNPWLPDLIICRPPVLAAIREGLDKL
ncbi:3'(2'),5'-bisphosphate nucleotidase CysQ [Leekyejoonella antrihumi]|uniref:3'(2'),5-bisphosphonucleoside 3'(2')-phosphohydrolase n=2 Tax=Leekyejoonella antrihumi TaxID=1660198 RepID=A0A563E0E1_9MICO|nr:3'(2'),5'-bisphosphate nucleotidase CysQ [Leekyejoonella antrihumi]